MGAPGPTGSPKTNTQMQNKAIHAIKKKAEYGNIIEISVPTPASILYLITVAIISPK